MRVIIEGEPKEIAALALAVQERQKDFDENLLKAVQERQKNFDEKLLMAIRDLGTPSPEAMYEKFGIMYSIA